jgi:hypothetical protein
MIIPILSKCISIPLLRRRRGIEIVLFSILFITVPI